MKFENMLLNKETSNEKPKEVSEKELLSSEEIKPEIVENIKREDVGNLEAAKKELANFAANEKGGENAEIIALAKQKLDEMQEEIEKKKKGFFNKMIFNKDEIATSENVISRAKAMLAKGELPDMHTIKDKVKFADDVDLTGLPERAGKSYQEGSASQKISG